MATLAQALDPADSTGPAVRPTDFDKPFQDGIASAVSQQTAATGAMAAAQASLDAIPPAPAQGLDLNADLRKAAMAHIDSAAALVQKASDTVTKAHSDYATAIREFNQKSQASPGLTAHYTALAASEDAATQLAIAQTNQLLSSDPTKKAQLDATLKQTQLANNLAQSQLGLADATKPDDIAKNHIAVQAAQTALDGAVTANKAAGLNTDIIAANAAVAPRLAAAAATTAEGGASSATSKATVDAATAGTAQQTALQGVQTTQAALDKSNQDLLDLQRLARQAPTDSQAAEALQTQIDQKKLDVATGEQALTAAKQLLGPAVDQAKATVAGTQATTAGTQANTQVTILGAGLAGAQERVKAISDLIRTGNLSPADGSAQLQAYLNATIAGTTVGAQQKDALTAETTRQDSANTLAGAQGASYASMASTAGSVFNDMNKNIAQGSDLGGKALLGMLDLGASRLRSFAPTTGAGDSPLLQSMRGLPAGAAPAFPGAPPVAAAPVTASAPAPTTTIAPDGTVTVSHVAATPTAAGLLGAGAAVTGSDPLTGGSGNPALLGAGALVLPHHVDSLWANDPNLNPTSNTTPSLRGAY